MFFNSILGIYFTIGIVFSLVFFVIGYKKLLPESEGTRFWVRILWMPGATAIWPILIYKWLSGNTHD